MTLYVYYAATVVAHLSWLLVVLPNVLLGDRVGVEGYEDDARCGFSASRSQPQKGSIRNMRVLQVYHGLHEVADGMESEHETLKG